MAKLSSREQKVRAAKKAGGTLNYKTGKITVPAKKSTTSSKPSSSQSNSLAAPDGAVGSAPGGGWLMSDGSVQRPMSSRTNPEAMNYQPEQTFSAPKSSNKSNSSNKSSSNKSSDPAYSYTPPAPAPATTGFKGFLNKTFGEDSTLGKISDAGLTQGNAGRLGGLIKGITPTAQGSGGPSIDASMGHGTADINDLIYPMGIDPTKSFTDSSLRVDPNQAEVPLAPPAPEVGTNNDPMNQPQTNNGGGNMSVDAMGNSVRSGGSTSGKGSSSDPYGKYEKYLKSARDAQEQAFKEMLNQIDPTYEGYQTDYEQALNDSMEQERQALLARQMSYGTADSEQREQAEGRLTSDFAKQRATFMRQLAEKEAAQRADIGGQRANALSSIDMQSANAMLDAYKYQQAQQQQEFENQLKMMGMRASGSNSANKTEQEKRMWIDEQKQNWVNSGSYKDGAFNVPDGGREAINARYQSYWGEPNNYAIPDYWEQTIIPSPNYKWVAPTQFEKGYYVDQQGNRVG